MHILIRMQLMSETALYTGLTWLETSAFTLGDKIHYMFNNYTPKDIKKLDIEM